MLRMRRRLAILFLLLVTFSGFGSAQENDKKFTNITLGLSTIVEEMSSQLSLDADFEALSLYALSTDICGPGRADLAKVQKIINNKKSNILGNASPELDQAFKNITRGEERAMAVTISAIFLAIDYQTRGALLSLFSDKDETSANFICSELETDALRVLLSSNQ